MLLDNFFVYTDADGVFHMLCWVQIQPHSIHHVQGTLVMACVDQRLKLIDVNKMVVVRSFQGRLYKSSKDCTHLINNGKGWYTILTVEGLVLSTHFTLHGSLACPKCQLEGGRVGPQIVGRDFHLEKTLHLCGVA